MWWGVGGERGGGAACEYTRVGRAGVPPRANARWSPPGAALYRTRVAFSAFAFWTTHQETATSTTVSHEPTTRTRHTPPTP